MDPVAKIRAENFPIRAPDVALVLCCRFLISDLNAENRLSGALGVARRLNPV